MQIVYFLYLLRIQFNRSFIELRILLVQLKNMWKHFIELLLISSKVILYPASSGFWYNKFIKLTLFIQSSSQVTLIFRYFNDKYQSWITIVPCWLVFDNEQSDLDLISGLAWKDKATTSLWIVSIYRPVKFHGYAND